MPRSARRARLRSASDYEKVFEQGVRLQQGAFTAVFVCRQHGARLGFAISRKAVSLATQRNRLKRQARETFKRAMRASPGVDVVLLAKARAVALPNAVLRETLERTWLRIQKQCQES